MCIRDRSIGLSLKSVVKVDVLLRDSWDIPIMEKVFRYRFSGNFPARKTIETNFAHVEMCIRDRYITLNSCYSYSSFISNKIHK